MARYRAAVIGLGRIGWAMEADERRPKPATHVGAWLACRRAELAWISDLDGDRIINAMHSLPPGLFGDKEFERCLRAEVVHIISVATPPETHRSIVEACAAAGVKAIVCEKPLAPTPADCRAMIAACAASGSRLFVNHSRRFDPILRAAAAEVPERLGEIVQVVGHYSGGLWNSGTHMVDLIRMLCGELAWALGGRRPFDEAPDPGYDAILQLEHGARVTLLAHDVRDYAIFDLHIYGRRGALHVTDSGFTVAWESTEEHADFSGYRRLSSPLYEAGGDSRSFMAPMAEHVCDVLDGTAEPVSTGEDGLAAVLVLRAIQSAGHGARHV